MAEAEGAVSRRERFAEMRVLQRKSYWRNGYREWIQGMDTGNRDGGIGSIHRIIDLNAEISDGASILLLPSKSCTARRLPVRR
jgi:hypothetical protein